MIAPAEILFLLEDTTISRQMWLQRYIQSSQSNTKYSRTG